jgi:hypothetical protein
MQTRCCESCGPRRRSRANPLTEVELVMGGVVALAVLGTVAFLVLGKNSTTSAALPATSSPGSPVSDVMVPTPGVLADQEPPFVPGT